MEPNRRILPYYMTYPGVCGIKREDAFAREMEYLQQIYPAEVRKYQKRVSEIMDRTDYEGSMIYDEYPDRITLENIIDSIVRVLQREEEADGNGASPEEKWVWVHDLTAVLVCNEVYRRRHGRGRGRMNGGYFAGIY